VKLSKKAILSVTLISHTLYGFAAVPVANPPLPPASLAAPAAAGVVGLPPLPPVPKEAIKSLTPDKPLDLGDSFKSSFPDGIKLTEFAYNVLHNVVKKPFILTPDFLSFEGSVGVDSATYKNKDSVNLLSDVLEEVGYSLVWKGSYYTIVKMAPAASAEKHQEDFIYHVRYRDLSYLSSILQPLFKDGSFTFQRSGGSVSSKKQTTSETSATSGVSAPGTSGSATGGTTASSTGKPVDDGKSEYSNLTQTNLDTFLFRGTSAEISRLTGLLAKLDVPTPQIAVRAYFLEVGKVDSKGGGISFVANLLSSHLGITLNSTNTGNQLTFKTGSFSSVIAALDSANNIKTLVSPAVFAKSGQQTSFSVGEDIPSLGQISYNGNGQSSQSVNTIKAGSTIDLLPRVYDDVISLDIHQQVSEPVADASVIQGAVEIDNRELTTSLDIKPGSWVLLGGYTADKDSRTIGNIPFTHIPLNRSISEDRREIVLLMYVDRLDSAAASPSSMPALPADDPVTQRDLLASPNDQPMKLR
jgi:hypothetical protein